MHPLLAGFLIVGVAALAIGAIVMLVRHYKNSGSSASTSDTSTAKKSPGEMYEDTSMDEAQKHQAASSTGTNIKRTALKL